MVIAFAFDAPLMDIDAYYIGRLFTTLTEYDGIVFDDRRWNKGYTVLTEVK